MPLLKFCDLRVTPPLSCVDIWCFLSYIYINLPQCTSESMLKLYDVKTQEWFAGICCMTTKLIIEFYLKLPLIIIKYKTEISVATKVMLLWTFNFTWIQHRRWSKCCTFEPRKSKFRVSLNRPRHFNSIFLNSIKVFTSIDYRHSQILW